MTSIYQADNTQLAARYGISSFQPAVIGLEGVDLRPGVYYPQFEGDFIFVESCDFPVSCNLVDKSSGKEISFLLQAGKTVVAPFKGLTFYGPFFNDPSFTTARVIKLLIGKGEKISMNNDSAYPSASFFPPGRTIVNTAAQHLTAHPVPRGARVLTHVQARGPGTVLGALNAYFVNAAGTQIGSLNLQTETRTYAAATGGFNGQIALTGRIVGGGYIAELPFPFVIPYGADEVLIDINGTLAIGLQSNYVAFS